MDIDKGMKGNNFLVGAATIDITPPIGTIINGDFVAHYAKTIHDRLYAKAIVFYNGVASFVIVIVDTCSMNQAFLLPVKQAIEKETAIPFHHILIAATHIHSGGSVNDIFLSAADKNYSRQLQQSLVHVVSLARKKLMPAKLAFGEVKVPDHVVSRRYRMRKSFQHWDPLGIDSDKIFTNPVGYENEIKGRSGVADPGLSFLAIQSLTGQWLGLLANYSLHYVGDFATDQISADYFGFFSNEMQNCLAAGDNFVGVLCNGTSGNINIWDFLHPNRYPPAAFEKSRLIARDLAHKIAERISGLEWEDKGSIIPVYEEMTANVRKPSPKELLTALQVMKHTNYDDMIIADRLALQKIYAREQVLLSEEPDSITVPLQVVRIGRGVIGALPGEFFAETGLWLKQQMNDCPYFTISIANDNIGYVPPEHEMNNGGYETWQSRSSKLKKDTEATIRKKMIQLLQKISGSRQGV